MVYCGMLKTYRIIAGFTLIGLGWLLTSYTFAGYFYQDGPFSGKTRVGSRMMEYEYYAFNEELFVGMNLIGVTLLLILAGIYLLKRAN